MPMTERFKESDYDPETLGTRQERWDLLFSTLDIIASHEGGELSEADANLLREHLVKVFLTAETMNVVGYWFFPRPSRFEERMSEVISGGLRDLGS